MKRTILAFVTLFWVLAFTANADESQKVFSKKTTTNQSGILIGKLGYPIGSYLTIEGKRINAIKTGVSTLVVFKVNGKKLKEPVGIWIDNVNLPDDITCILKGYETIRTIGQPPAIQKWAKENGKYIPQPQAVWQVKFYFRTLSVVKPKELKIRKKP